MTVRDTYKRRAGKVQHVGPRPAQNLFLCDFRAQNAFYILKGLLQIKQNISQRL